MALFERLGQARWASCAEDTIEPYRTGLPSTHRGSAALAPAVCAYADANLDDAAVVELLSAEGIAVYRGWNDFRENGLDRANAAVYASGSLTGPAWNGLLRLRREHEAPALLIITAHTRANTRALTHVEIDELLFLDDLSKDLLAAAIAGLARRTTLRLAAAALRENAVGLDPELAEMLARACNAPRLVGSVDELARIMGYHRSILTRRWNKCTPAVSQPHHFLEWLLLTHGLLLRSRTGRSWPKVAKALGIQGRTLTSTCKRLFGVELEHLEHFDRDRVLAVLWEIVGEPRADRRGQA